MKIYYFNDTSKTQTAYAGDFNGSMVHFPPHTGGEVEVPVPNDSVKRIPFIKVWNDGKVLISTMDMPNE